MVICAPVMCEKCGLQYVRAYEINQDKFVIEHPKSMCPDSGKKFYEQRIELEEFMEVENAANV